MNIRLNTTPVCLVKNQTLSVTDAKGSLINCHRGALWITQDNDRRDIVLMSGESFTFDRDGQAIVSAMDDSSVELLPPSHPRLADTVVGHRAGRAYTSRAAALGWDRRSELSH